MENETTIRRLPFYKALIYASGYFGVQLIGWASGQIPQWFYVPRTGEICRISDISIFGLVLLGPNLYGLLKGISLFFDAIIDPWIGNFSDHWKGKLGRRKPFILIGAPLMGVFLILLTIPPSLTQPSLWNLLWLALIFPLFFIASTMAITPYLAMLPEITPHPKDRLLVTTLQSIFLIAGTFTGVLIIGAMPEKLPFTTGTTIIALLAALPFLFIVGFVQDQPKNANISIEPRPSTIGQIKEALAFKPFRIYLTGVVLFYFGFNMIETGSGYIAKLLPVENAYQIMLGVALGVAAFFGPFAFKTGRKLGKKRAILLMSILFAAIFPFIGLAGRGIFENPVLCFALFGVLGIPLSLLLVIPNSLLADIIDADIKRSGARREGLFFASQALLNRAGIGLSQSILNFILPIGAATSSFGSQSVGETGVRLIGPVAAVFILFGFLIFRKLPEIEKRDIF